MKDIREILTDFNSAISGSYERNKQVLDDTRFAKVAGEQWRGSDYEQFKNKPKPENNKIARQINRILGQYQRLEMNAIIVSASDEATDEDADLLQSRWRNDFNISDGVESLNNAADEAFTGGFGAFKWVQKYEDEENPDSDKQYLCQEPIYSAASSVVFNAGALRKDKADATQCWQVVRVNRKETEDEYNTSISTFNQPTSYENTFDWATDNSKDVYIAHYWEVTTRTVTELSFDGMLIVIDGGKAKDQDGNKITRDELDELKAYNVFTTKKKKVKRVEYALLSGDKFLIKGQSTSFKRIPVIPQYGYHTVINGIEYYCGEVCRQRDNQRFLNMGFSSLMEIMAAPQVEKPEYAPEQVQRHAQTHAEMNTKDYPYKLSDPIKDLNGNIQHLGPIGKHMPPQIGTGLATAITFLNENVAEQGGTGQTTLPANASADAVKQVNQREDDSYQPLFQNAMQSLKASCNIWIPAAQELYFSNERSLRVQSQDGSYSQVETLQYDTDDNGNYGPFKNSARGRYDVSVKIDESHQSKKDAEKQTSLDMLQYTDTTSPKGQMLLNNAILATTGEGGSDARRIARFENLSIMFGMGIDPQPKTDEEKAYVQQLAMQQQAQQQNQQPDPMMLAAQAEMQKGLAAQQEAQVKSEKNQIDLYKAQTTYDINQEKNNIEAAKAGVSMQNMQVDTVGKQIENANKLQEAMQPRYGGLTSPQTNAMS